MHVSAWGWALWWSLFWEQKKWGVQQHRGDGLRAVAVRFFNHRLSAVGGFNPCDKRPCGRYCWIVNWRSVWCSHCCNMQCCFGWMWSKALWLHSNLMFTFIKTSFHSFTACKHSHSAWNMVDYPTRKMKKSDKWGHMRVVAADSSKVICDFYEDVQYLKLLTCASEYWIQ